MSGKFQDKMPRYIQTTQDMYLGGVPVGYIDTVRNRDFDSVILTSLKGGSIRDLTFEDKYVYSFFSRFSFSVKAECAGAHLKTSSSELRI